MKLFKFLPFALAITAMVGCSDDSFVETPGDSGILEDGGTVTVNISLPSTSVRTRATAEGEQEEETPIDPNGKTNEYAVNNGTIVLFDADKRVIIKQVFSGDNLGFDNNSANNITSTSQTIVIPEKSVAPKYVLALLNINPQVSAALNNAATFADFQIAIQGNSGIDKDGYFFMSNSTFDNTQNDKSIVYYTNPGLQDLQEINPNSIKKSTTSNVVVTPTQIYVERASAKVDLTMKLENQIKTGKGKVELNTNRMPIITFTTGDQLFVNGWTLTVKNKQFYPVKHITNDMWTEWNLSEKYQMAFNNALCDSENFRSYWAADPTYPGLTSSSNNGIYDEFIYSSYSNATTLIYDDLLNINPLYCLENTFIAANQKQDQTTSILIAAQYKLENENLGINIYTINGNVYNSNELQSYITTVLNASGYTNNGNALTTENFEISPDKLTHSDIVKFIGESLLIPGSQDTVASGEYINAVLNNVLGENALTYYHEGRCYYMIPIRHFDDTQVKLYDTTTNNYFVFNKESGVNKPNQLGRYGIVRNNWYSVNVSSINQIGRPAPVDPEIPIPGEPTPDDTESYYLNAEISILPWAKRSQNADL